VDYTGSIFRELPLRTRLVLVTLFAAQAFAQQPDQPVTTLKLSTSMVSVAAVVLDGKGEPLAGLTKDDFALKQDGQPQEIRYFAEDENLPLTLALLVDTSGSQRMFIEDEIMASEKFYRAMLTRPADRASLIQFDTAILERQPLTSAVRTLESSLNFLSMPHPDPPHARGGTLLYDAICDAARSFPSGDQGRRAMVILTDGEDHGSVADLPTAISAAQRADIVVFAIVYSAEEFASGMGRRAASSEHPSGRAVLDSLANSTGGRVFSIAGRSQLDLVYAAIAADMRLQYQIGYTPPASDPGKYHKIELKSDLKHVVVHARQGFYTPK